MACLVNGIAPAAAANVSEPPGSMRVLDFKTIFSRETPGRRELRVKAVDATSNARLHQGFAEVEQIAEFASFELYVCLDLFLMSAETCRPMGDRAKSCSLERLVRFVPSLPRRER